MNSHFTGTRSVLWSLPFVQWSLISMLFFFPGPFMVLGRILYPKSSHCGLMQPGEVSENRLGNQMEVLWGNFPSSVLHFVLPALLCKRFRFVTQGLRGKARPQMGHDWQLQEEKPWPEAEVLQASQAGPRAGLYFRSFRHFSQASLSRKKQKSMSGPKCYFNLNVWMRGTMCTSY